MDFVVDLDPTHLVLRLTVTTALTDESATRIYQATKLLTSRGGPYSAVITDFSQVVDFPVSSDTIRALAARGPAVAGEGPRVMVAREPALYGLARMFELYLELLGGPSPIVVKSIDEAYGFLGVSPQDFTQRLNPEDLKA